MADNSIINELSNNLIKLRNDHKEFKKDNKEIFVAHRQFNKSIKNAETELIKQLEENNVQHFEVDGVTIALKEKKSIKHDMEKLRGFFEDDTTFLEYNDMVTKSTTSVATRLAKKKKTTI